MARLTVSLLGFYGVELDGKPVTAFTSDKVRALLAYLATEAGRPHRRETLAGLLWPDWPERSARANLRNTLYNLRKVLGDLQPTQVEHGASPFLIVTRHAVQFNAASDHRIDVAAFQHFVDAHPVNETISHALEEAVGLYRGPFLEGFSLADSPTFEDWALVLRERLQRQVLAVLQQMISYYEQQGDIARACEFAWRQVELAPWHEQAHRALMRLLALSGQRGAALAQYGACRRALKGELDVEPGEETTLLYERIRDGELGPPPQVMPAQATMPPAASLAQADGATAPPLPAQPFSPPVAPPAGKEKALGGERRTITALAACIQATAAQREPIDVEIWAEVMSLVLPLLEAAITRYGGTCERYRDNGLIALFGASVTHEDDPERAVLAALAIQEEIQPALAELVQREQVHLALYAGIHTGEAIVTSAGDRALYWAAPVFDQALDLAEPNDRTIEPGTVLVTEQTYHLVAPLFVWATLHEVAVYRALAHQGITDKGRGIEGLSSPLVGRDAELHALQDSLTALQNGVGGIVTVVGEAGIGKSRLVAEALQSTHSKSPNLRSPNLTSIEGRCLSYATHVAYQLWQDLLRSWLDLAPEAPPLAVRDALRKRVQALCGDGSDQVYPYLGLMLALPPEEETEARMRGLDGASLQFITFRAVETLLAHSAARRPLVVVCEDLHWADATSLALLGRLLALTDRVPLLLICVLRPERAHGCWQIVEAAAREYAHSHTALALEPLSHAASASMIDNLLGIDDLPHALRARILDHAEGNPLYLEEILRSLIDGEIIAADASSDDVSSGDASAARWQVTQDVDDIPIPDTLHGVLAARIDRLPAEAKRVLQLASVIGRSFTYPVLSAIAGPPPRPPSRAQEGGASLDAHLITLQRAQLIRQRRRVPEPEYAFKHHLTQEAAYSSLLGRERRATHRQVAEALEALYPDRVSPGRGEGQLGLLAHHWEQAGEIERAIPYLRRVGEQAAAQYANDEAIGDLGRALELTPEDDLETRFALLLVREAVYDVQGARQLEHQDLEALEALAEAMDDDGRRAEVAWRQARYAVMIADHPAAVAAAKEAVRLAQAAHDVESEAQAHLYWGWVTYRLRNREAASSQFRQALTLAQAASLHRIEAASLRQLGRICRQPDDSAQAVAYYEQALRLFRQIGDRRGEGTLLHSLGEVYYGLDDLARAKSCQEQALCILSGIGERLEEGWTLLSLGRIYARLEDYGQACAYCEGALAAFDEIGARSGQAQALTKLGNIHSWLGDYVRAHTYCEQAFAIYGEIGGGWGQAQALLDLGRVRAWLGDYARARAYFEQGLRTPHRTSWGAGLFILLQGRISHYLGDDQAALEYGRQALQLAASQDVGGVQRKAYFVLGHAFSGLGRVDDAVAAYEQSAALYRDLDQFDWMAALPLAERARVALAQGEHAQALAHIEEILDVLETHPRLEGTWEPLRVYLNCYHVLHANRDPRADGILDAAYRLIQERADKIDDEALRRSYLENVAENREIVALWEEATHR